MISKERRENSVVITDTSCFVLLEKINALLILRELFTTVLTTPEIAKEYGSPLPGWVTIQPVRIFHFNNNLLNMLIWEKLAQLQKI